MLPKYQLDGYKDLGATTQNEAILQNFPYALDTPGTGWIALNPRHVNRLGWSNSEDRLLTWKDMNGELAVFTLWWNDGNVDGRSLSESVEVCEGWLALASPTAVHQIEQEFGALNYRYAVERSIVLEAKRQSRPYTSD